MGLQTRPDLRHTCTGTGLETHPTFEPVKKFTSSERKPTIHRCPSPDQSGRCMVNRMVLLTVREVTKHYGPEPVLAGVTFDLRGGLLTYVAKVPCHDVLNP